MNEQVCPNTCLHILHKASSLTTFLSPLSLSITSPFFLYHSLSSLNSSFIHDAAKSETIQNFPLKSKQYNKYTVAIISLARSSTKPFVHI